MDRDPNDLTPADVDLACSLACRSVLPGMLEEHRLNIGPPAVIALNHETWWFLTGRANDDKLLGTKFLFNGEELDVIFSESIPDGEVKIATRAS